MDPTDINLMKPVKVIFNGKIFTLDELINVIFLGATSGNTFSNHVNYHISSFGVTTSSFGSTTYSTFECT